MHVYLKIKIVLWQCMKTDKFTRRIFLYDSLNTIRFWLWSGIQNKEIKACEICEICGDLNETAVLSEQLCRSMIQLLNQ